MRRAHAWVGTLTLVAFLATGAYMNYRVPPVDQLEDVTRAVYRSRHLFVMCAGLANVATASREAVRKTDYAISALLMLAPVFLLIAFFTEPEQGIHGPSYASQIGLYSMFAAAVLLAVPRKR